MIRATTCYYEERHAADHPFTAMCRAWLTEQFMKRVPSILNIIWLPRYFSGREWFCYVFHLYHASAFYMVIHREEGEGKRSQHLPTSYKRQYFSNCINWLTQPKDKREKMLLISYNTHTSHETVSKSGNALDDNADTAQWRSSWLIRWNHHVRWSIPLSHGRQLNSVASNNHTHWTAPHSVIECCDFFGQRLSGHAEQQSHLSDISQCADSVQ